MIRTEKITVTVAGSAGSAAGNTTSRQPLNGELLAVYLDHTTGAATADVTIATVNAPVKTLLTVTDSATDAWYYPRYIISSEAAVALTGTSGGDRAKHPLDDYVKVTVAQSDAGSVDAYIVYDSSE